MAKSFSNYLKLVLGESDDTALVAPDIFGNFAKIDAHVKETDQTLNALDEVPNELALETQQRMAGDSALSQAVTNEAIARAEATDALNGEVELLGTSLTNEANARAAVDNVLTTSVDEIRNLPTISITRDATGRVDSTTTNGVTESYTRDALGRVRTVTRGDTTKTVTRTPTGAVSGMA